MNGARARYTAAARVWLRIDGTPVINIKPVLP
jgi:hypothetical protein